MLRISHRREFDEPNSFATSVQKFGRNLERETRLAGAAGASECHQSTIHDEVPHFFQLRRAAYKRIERGGKIVGEIRIVERTQWFKL